MGLQIYKIAFDPNSPAAVGLIDNNGNYQCFSQLAFKDLRVVNLYPQALLNFTYNINTDMVNITGSVAQSNSQAVLATAASASSVAQLQSRRYSRCFPGMGMLVVASAIFSAGVTGNTQIVGIGDSSNGLFFGYNGTSFGVMWRQNGTDNWISQSSWNGDKLNGTGQSGVTLDPTKGNEYIIDFQWLGFGLITFGVVDPNTGYTTIVHRVKYPNTSTDVNLFIPNLQLMAQTKNTTNTTVVTLKTACMAVYLEGTPNAYAGSTANAIYNNSASGTAGTETNILSIQNKTAVSSITNHTLVMLESISLTTTSTSGNTNVSVQLVRNGTVSGSYTDINATNSVVAYNTAGAYTAGTGKFTAGFQLQKTDIQTIDLTDYQYFLYPGETMTVTALLRGATGTNNMTVSLNWREYY